MTNIDWRFILIQIIGAIGYALLSISFYRKDKRQILFMQIIANMFFTVHYSMLSGIAGAISNVLGLITYIVIYIMDKYKLKKSKNIFSLFMILFLLIAVILAYENIYSILPFIAFSVAIISFLTGDEDKIRKLGIIVAICWLVYAIVYVSYAAIVFETITLIATAVSLIKNPKEKVT
ncbi:MAG: YgjV family protein [Clostridia bacterium]|nr:YgjV family protein [Clostridia bacterium]